MSTSIPALVKTRLCRRQLIHHTCPHGKSCPFAHSLSDLCEPSAGWNGPKAGMDIYDADRPYSLDQVNTFTTYYEWEVEHELDRIPAWADKAAVELGCVSAMTLAKRFTLPLLRNGVDNVHVIVDYLLRRHPYNDKIFERVRVLEKNREALWARVAILEMNWAATMPETTSAILGLAAAQDETKTTANAAELMAATFSEQSTATDAQLADLDADLDHRYGPRRDAIATQDAIATAGDSVAAQDAKPTQEDEKAKEDEDNEVCEEAEPASTFLAFFLGPSAYFEPSAGASRGTASALATRNSNKMRSVV